jgi:two-component system chemotaxis response regulator CheB
VIRPRAAGSAHSAKRRARRASASATELAAPHPFGYADRSRGELTDLGCPDCRGVLGVAGQGESGFLLFRCRVGHAFSVESLLQLKEDELESSLWTTIELCEELASLSSYLADSADGGSHRAAAARWRRRISTARRHAAALRGIVAKAGPSPHTAAASPDSRRR